MTDRPIPRPNADAVFIEWLIDPLSEMPLLGVGTEWVGAACDQRMMLEVAIDGRTRVRLPVSSQTLPTGCRYHAAGHIPREPGEVVQIVLVVGADRIALVERPYGMIPDRNARTTPPAARSKSQRAITFLKKVIGHIVRGRIFSRAGRAEIREDWFRLRQFINTRRMRQRYPTRSPHQGFIAHDDPTPAQLEEWRAQAQKLTYRPKISLIVPVYNVDPKWLAKAIESVQAQVYDNWELCLADDASDRPLLKAYLDHLPRDPRIQLVRRPRNGHISAASNSASQLASGTFVALLDNDDCLAPHALFEVVRLLQDHPEADVIYSDEDKINESDERYDPQFKPDWSREMFMAYNYLNHFTVIRRSIFEKVGRFRLGYEGSQDHDLLLRVVSETDRVFHIPKILYHWRSLPSSTAATAMVKPWVHTSGRKALEDYLYHQRIDATPYRPPIAERLGLPINLLDWSDHGGSAAIIIHAPNDVSVLKRCLDAILAQTSYQNYRIEVAVSGANSAVRAYLGVMTDQEPRLSFRSVDAQSPAAVYNEVVDQLVDDWVLFLDPHLIVREPRWLSRLIGYASINGVGITGAAIHAQDGAYLHAGIVLGMRDGIAPAHAFHGLPGDAVSYYFQAEIARNVSAVSVRCLLTRRKSFDEVAGFDVGRFPESLFDVDYAMRLAQRGLRTVYVGSAVLVDSQVMTATSDHDRNDRPTELLAFRRIYGRVDDPYYNPNLSEGRAYQLGIASRSRADWPSPGRPLRTLVIAHNLNNPEGAPRYLSEIVLGLRRRGVIDPAVWSPLPGRGADVYTAEGVPVDVGMSEHSQRFVDGRWDRASYFAVVQQAMRDLRKRRPDVIIINTMVSFPLVEAAARLGIPTVWIIHESYNTAQRQAMFGEYGAARCEAAFQYATRIVPASHDTARLFDSLNGRHNLVVLHNGLSAAPFDDYCHRVSKVAAAANLPGGPNRRRIISVGTVCERKGQHTLVQAIAQLRPQRDDFSCYLVGLREQLPYARYVQELVEQHRLHDCVYLIPETDQVQAFYRAADVFVCTSHMETFSRAILEAEAFGLPIVSTPCPGVREQVYWGHHALRFDRGDVHQLAAHLNRLLDDDALRQRMSEESRAAFDNHLNEAEMLDRYQWVLLQAARPVTLGESPMADARSSQRSAA